jgi:hypothetical protein
MPIDYFPIMPEILNIFTQEIKCRYKTEYYSVRDNGSVLRHAPEGKNPRPTDNNWTFGKLNIKTGYLEISSVRVHRIVATAFHGDPPTKEHIVDHKDTNRQNNRPENLRWLTRLENAILNPITAKRIAYVCGTIEAFLNDPSQFRDKFPEPNLNWMQSVTLEEAQISKERLLKWANTNNQSAGYTLDKWIFQNRRNSNSIQEKEVLDKALTPNAVQNGWKTPSEFLCCPIEHTANPIDSYFKNLKVGEVFLRNKYSESIIMEFAISKDLISLWTICKSNDVNAIKPWLVAQVTYVSNSFLHANLGSFFNKDGATKQFTISQGLEWTGGDTFDDLVS